MANLPNGTQSEQDQSIGTLNLKIPVERLRDMPVEHLDAIHDLATGQLPGAKPATRFGVPIVQPGPAQRAPSTLKRFAGGVGRVGKDIASPFTFMGSTIKGNVQTIQDIRRARAEEARGTAARQQAEAGLTQAQVAAGLPEAQAAEATGRGAYAEAEAQALQKGLSAIEDPNVQGAWKTLSDPKAPLDQRRDAMATIGQAFGAVPMLRGELGAAENIYRQGEIGGRLMRGPVIQTAQGPMQTFIQREAEPAEGLAGPGYYPHAGTTTTWKQGPGGVWEQLQEPRATAPQLPGGQAVAPSKALPAQVPPTTREDLGIPTPPASVKFSPLSGTDQTQITQLVQNRALAQDTLTAALSLYNKAQGQVGQKAQQWTMSKLYQMGFDTGELQSNFTQLAGLLQISGVAPLLHSMRRWEYAQKAMLHLSDPSATLASNIERLQGILKTVYPDLLSGIFQGHWGKYGEYVGLHSYGVLPKGARPITRSDGQKGYYLNGKPYFPTEMR